MVKKYIRWLDRSCGDDGDFPDSVTLFACTFDTNSLMIEHGIENQSPFSISASIKQVMAQKPNWWDQVYSSKAGTYSQSHYAIIAWVVFYGGTTSHSVYLTYWLIPTDTMWGTHAYHDIMISEYVLSVKSQH